MNRLALTFAGLIGLAACQSGNPSAGELERVVRAAEASRSAGRPELSYLRPVAFAGPGVTRASIGRRSLRAYFLELLDSSEPGPPSTAGAAEGLVLGQQPGVAADPADPHTPVAAESALGLLRTRKLGAGRALAIGPEGGLQVLIRAADAQRAALEPALEQDFLCLARDWERGPGGPLRYELVLWLGSVEPSVRDSFPPARVVCEFAIAGAASVQRPAEVPLLVRGIDPGWQQPLPPDSAASNARFRPTQPWSGEFDVYRTQSGAALWLRQAWMDLGEVLGPIPAGEAAGDPESAFGPRLCPSAPCVGIAFGPHGELGKESPALLPGVQAERRIRWAVLFAALSLADPEPEDFTRAMASLDEERRLRLSAVETAKRPDLAHVWRQSLEFGRSWLRRVCFGLERDDALETLLDSAEVP